MLLTIFEPGHSQDLPFQISSTTYILLLLVEVLFISIFIVDDVIELIHRITDQERKKSQQFFYNLKFLSKYIIDLILIVDFICFYTFYGSAYSYFRFGRCLRPFKLFVNSRDMRRTLHAILATFPHILDVVLLFIFTALIFAIFGSKLFEAEEDTNVTHIITLSLRFLDGE